MSKNIERGKSLPFPWKCGHCGERTVRPVEVEYTTEIVHDGRSYTVKVPALHTPRCENEACKEIVLDTAANRQISEAFRRLAHLLTPKEIRQRRKALGLSQGALAARLSVAQATLSRWETGGQIQQRALDKLLRLFFGLPAVRHALAAHPQGAFRHLQPTEEVCRRARQFQLAPARHRPKAAEEQECPEAKAKLGTGSLVGE